MHDVRSEDESADSLHRVCQIVNGLRTKSRVDVHVSREWYVHRRGLRRIHLGVRFDRLLSRDFFRVPPLPIHSLMVHSRIHLRDAHHGFTCAAATWRKAARMIIRRNPPALKRIAQLSNGSVACPKAEHGALKRAVVRRKQIAQLRQPHLSTLEPDRTSAGLRLLTVKQIAQLRQPHLSTLEPNCASAGLWLLAVKRIAGSCGFRLLALDQIAVSRVLRLQH